MIIEGFMTEPHNNCATLIGLQNLCLDIDW